MGTLQQIHSANAAAVSTHWQVAAQQYSMISPPVQAAQVGDIDVEHVQFWSKLALRGNLTLEDIVKIYRGQTPEDTRPNKNLYAIEPPHHPEITSTVTRWNQIVRDGVKPQWLSGKPCCQVSRPNNHRSINGHDAHIRRHLRKGQLEGRYLIVDAQLLGQWPELFISPLAVVDKPGVVAGDIRLINDYSYPPDASVNDYTDRSDHPSISYNPPRAIARRIHRLKKSYPSAIVLLMLGDVAGAFRHIPIHAASVHMFCFRYENFLVIDLSCGFGWCGSPAYYAVAGKLINHLYEFSNHRTRQFRGNVWCDDHTCVETDAGTRCFDANLSLRRAMATVLGPSAINEQKFTAWSTKNKHSICCGIRKPDASRFRPTR
ncbi:unnamed protein product [Phytophthora fragariaefolia]|uniref:Unnamed protein product n=1 Tax=Phytophthora fragariaefolia TaxID=1490495 RepID=A0A9W6XG93_9STRA|nr:unnamed protein product [Phytophthora fragariaefolia]